MCRKKLFYAHTFGRFLSLAISACLCMTISFCEQQFQVTFGGAVAPKNSLSVRNINQNIKLIGTSKTGLQSTDFSIGALIKIFDFTIDNNSPSGFNISMESQNLGELRHESQYEPQAEASYLPYLVTVQESGKGSLGARCQTGTEIRDSSLLDPQIIMYSEDVHQATQKAQWDVYIRYREKELFSGFFSDTIVVSISNL